MAAGLILATGLTPIYGSVAPHKTFSAKRSLPERQSFAQRKFAMSYAHEVKPKVSVIMPAYNAERYLAEAINSVLDQSLRDFELLVLDDGSTDGSLGIARDYESNNFRVRVLARKHRGIANSRTDLIDNARGDYVAVMGADDISLPQRLEKQVEFLDANSDCVAVGGWTELVNAKGQPVRVLDFPLSHSEIDERNLEGRVAIMDGTAMIRRDVAASIPTSPYAYASDLDFWLRVAELGHLANIPRVLLKYRMHGAAVSEAHLDEQFASAQAICRQAWQRRGIEGRFTGEKNWRHASDIATRHKLLTQFAWIAWGNEHRETWWSYTCEAFRLRPLALSSWKLLVFGYLRSPKHA